MKVSIVTLCWNHLDDVTKPFIPEILKTAEVDYELIFVDNGSEDGTYKFLQDKFWGTPNVRVLRLEENRGWSGGNNYAFEHAKGEYICFINNDVIIHDPLWLKKLVDYADAHPKTALGPEVITDQPAAMWKDEMIHYLNGWCVFVAKEFMNNYGCFHKAFTTPYLEDVEFCVRLKHYGWTWEHFPCHITHLGARSTYDQIDMWGNANASQDTFIKLMEKLEKSESVEQYLTQDF